MDINECHLVPTFLLSIATEKRSQRPISYLETWRGTTCSNQTCISLNFKTYLFQFRNCQNPFPRALPYCSTVMMTTAREVNNLFPNLGHHLFQPDLNQWEQRAIDQSEAEVSAPSYCYISSSLGVLSLLRWNPIPSGEIGDHCASLCLNKL